MSLTWRPMRAADLPAVSALADRIHAAHPEAPAIFAERLRLFPRGCFVLAEGAMLLGYAVAHPGRLGAPPPLNSLLEALPARADCLYLHDIALAPGASRRGHGAGLVARLVELAIEFRQRRLALVAVSGSASYWARLGFLPVDDPALRAKLASYGGDAAYMVRELGSTKEPDGL